MDTAADAYEKLLKEYRELQLRVTKFSAVEQELINIRDRLDNELDMYKRLHQYSSKALRQETKKELLRFSTEAIVDIFETEGSLVLFERSGENPVSFLFTEGLRFETDEEVLKQHIRNISIEAAHLRKPILYADTLGKHTAFEPFREALWYTYHDYELDYTVHLAGIISNTRGALYSQMLDRHSAIFNVFAQQAISILGNFQRSMLIRRQVDKISTTAIELRKLSLIATKTKSGVIITDRFGNIEWINDSFTKTTGYTLDEVKGRKPKEFLQRNDGANDEARQILSQSLAKRETVEVTIVNYNKWGEPYYNQLEITPVFDEDGNHVNFIALQKDITVEMRFQEEMIHKNEELHKINAELDNFVYSISHDLRAPLLSIKGIIKLIHMKEKLGDQASKYLKMADESVDRLDGTVQEILDYSRNARLNLQVSEFDLRTLVDQIFDDLRFGTDKEFLFESSYDGSTIMASDRYRVNTLLKNIISNAVKYRNRSAEQAFVKVFVLRKDGIMTIDVVDNGIGIAPQNVERIFEMFFRASSEVTGTGLGLYICKEIMSRLGGTISVESELGHGTKMHIALPDLEMKKHTP
ncbi:MAG: sensor histidine kinase [Bacteroidota bacterium]